MGDAIAVVVAVHTRVPGRVRFRARTLYGSPRLGARLQAALLGCPGVRAATVSTLTCSVLIQFDPRLSVLELASALQSQLQSLQDDLRAPATAAEVLPEGLPAAANTRNEQRPSLWQWLRERLARPPAPRPDPGTPPARARAPLARLPARSRADESRPAWHTLAPADVLRRWQSRSEGLTLAQVARLQAEFGRNALQERPATPGWKLFFGQLASVPVALLLGSTVLSAATGGVVDAIVILGVVALNAVIGYFMERGAERTIGALMQKGTQLVPVVRAGQLVSVTVEEVVPGEVLALRAGQLVPADARLLESDGLAVDESVLTGESFPVNKRDVTLAETGLPLVERVNMVYRGTAVTGGSGLAVVVATGDRTEIGEIQRLVRELRAPETPLQQQLRRLGTQLVVISAVVCAAVLLIGILRGYDPLFMLKSAVALAVAAVPEGLPTVALTTLALGMRRMREQQVYVRQLAVVEALGAVQVMCLDKTGTITLNRMSLVALQAGRDFYRVRGGSFLRAGVAVAPDADVRALFEACVLCSEAEADVVNGRIVLGGSPTECALLHSAVDAGVDVPALRAAHPMVKLAQRAEQRTYMQSLHRASEGRLRVAVKGSPEQVLGMCAAIREDNAVRPMTDTDRSRARDQNAKMAAQAWRVLGVAGGEVDAGHGDGTGQLVWLGLAALSDPPRPGMDDLVARFRAAGIETKMITGDQCATASAVGTSIGLGGDALEILDSATMSTLSPEVLAARAAGVHVFARVSPAHKYEIVQALQKRGLVVAMTGDGVNDGPALKAADVGLALGAGATDVAREVADVVLADDDPRRILVAIEHGRTIYDDIRKAVRFILTTNGSEILVMFTALAAGLGHPLSAVQLLWINLLTDVFPEIALAMQPPEPDVMRRPPRPAGQGMFSRRDYRSMVGGSALLAGASLAAYVYGVGRHGAGAPAATMAFTSLTTGQLLFALSAESETRSRFQPGGPGNQYVALAVGGGLALQALTLLPGLRGVFGTASLGMLDWAVTGAAAVAPLLLTELRKLARASTSPIPCAATS